MRRADFQPLRLQKGNEYSATCEFSVCTSATLCVFVCWPFCVGLHFFNHFVQSCSDDVPGSPAPTMYQRACRQFGVRHGVKVFVLLAFPLACTTPPSHIHTASIRSFHVFEFIETMFFDSLKNKIAPFEFLRCGFVFSLLTTIITEIYSFFLLKLRETCISFSDKWRPQFHCSMTRTRARTMRASPTFLMRRARI